MKLRQWLLLMVVVAATGLAGCAVCDTCDDFPGPCVGPNCGQGGMQGQALPVMGTSTPPYSTPMAPNDSAGPAPTMPPATMEPAPR
jgi:hypothetical protein